MPLAHHLAAMYAATRLPSLPDCLENGCCSLWLVCQ